MNANGVLAILGSPRANGITAAMLDQSIREAEKAGYTVNKINLYEKQLSYCTGCRECLSSGKCVQKDDLQEIVPMLQKSKIVILAAPTYWANVPASVKNLFDRLLGTAMKETAAFPKPRLAGKKYILLSACNTPAPFSWIFGQSRGTIRSMDVFFKTAGMKSVGKVVCPNSGKIQTPPERILRKIGRLWK